MARRKRVAAPTEVDFDDADAVLEEVARALGEDPDDLEIEEEEGLTSFDAGTVYSITVSGGEHKEWQVVADDDQERALALAVVRQDLDEEPEIFNKDFIERHIDKDRLRDELRQDALDSRVERLSEMRPRRFWEEWEGEGLEAPEELEAFNDGEADDPPDPDDDDVQTLAEQQVDEELRDPMQYLEDIYGDEAASKALEIAGIDLDAAAEDAVDTDGPAHFLAHYDGHSHTTRSGLVYWRAN